MAAFATQERYAPVAAVFAKYRIRMPTKQEDDIALFNALCNNNHFTMCDITKEGTERLTSEIVRTLRKVGQKYEQDVESKNINFKDPDAFSETEISGDILKLKDIYNAQKNKASQKDLIEFISLIDTEIMLQWIYRSIHSPATWKLSKLIQTTFLTEFTPDTRRMAMIAWIKSGGQNNIARANLNDWSTMSQKSGRQKSVTMIPSRSIIPNIHDFEDIPKMNYEEFATEFASPLTPLDKYRMPDVSVDASKREIGVIGSSAYNTLMSGIIQRDYFSIPGNEKKKRPDIWNVIGDKSYDWALTVYNNGWVEQEPSDDSSDEEEEDPLEYKRLKMESYYEGMEPR